MEMLSCVLVRDGDQPLYEQLYRFIKDEIIAGRLKHGEKLPSKRKLSDFLKVSQNTVEAAYEQLVAEGYLESRERRGFFVAAYEDFVYTNTTKPLPKQEKSAKNWKYDFHPGKIDTKNFPFAKWRKYAKELMDRGHHDLLLHGCRQGEYALRKEIAAYLYHARGIICSPDEIIVGAGSEILLQQLVHLLGKQAVYGVEDPGYHVISRILEDYENAVCPLQVDEDGVIVKKMDHTTINVIYTTPSNHFPYGYVLPVNRRVKLLKWAMERQGRYIIEDDYDSEFRYTGKAIPALKGMDKSGKVIYFGSFSKSLIPSLRISYMLLPGELLSRYYEHYSYYHCTVSRIDQHILSRFMEAGDFEKHLNRMRKIYRHKLEKTMNLLNRYSEKLQVRGEQNGLHILLEINNGMDEKELVRHAAEWGMKVYPLSTYLLQQKEMKPPKIVFGFAGIAEEALEGR
ncbi:PLP-dependent aminotransferase family protein [Virgibacillus sp. 179-BFC.A HS]|uniref:PLP-dependent aminotransferase family protein n=1 Tax=Tigheibacillus jepli TaxID=3035914 RepID=A0ABU5CKC3_9BACI|nr:PLP-dependent aminotransferase family protein [Virgibacillus sp. 179-BFC.A HS]MDY0406806.1 PLP-dependent aminotransferase family protein [Virgibacillus sp. 179-BFC.A HS]